MMSRGSVIPLFIKQILSGEEVTITNSNMTRFLMSLQESVDLVKFAFKKGASGDLFVKKAPACTVQDLALGVAMALGKESELRIKKIGTRHGEKLYESLLSSEEAATSEDLGEYFKVPLDTRTLDYQIYFTKGMAPASNLEAYTSHNTKQLNPQEVAELIKGLPEFKAFVSSK